MPAEDESAEISHLVRDKGYPQKRAVAAALSMKRAGKFRGSSKRVGRRRRRAR